MGKFLLTCVFVMSLMFASLTVATEKSAILTVDSKKIIGLTNKLILGNNVIGFNSKFNDKGRYANYGAGIWDPAKGEPDPEFVKLARQAGISIIRWPGGNHSRTMNWKKSIGPVSKRPNQKFGLPEFLYFCKEVDAEPLIVVANQLGRKEDAADLVEYLNSPNDGKNPNGGKDWAAQRALDGNPEPIAARWFVLGNETFYTNMSATAYADKFLSYQAAMKAVDDKIKLGAVLEDSSNVDNGWTYTIFKKIGDKLDFGDFHPYFPNVSKKKAEHFSKRQIALSAVAADEDFIYRLSRYRELAENMLNRSDFPLVASEYNGLFIQNEPLPFRQTLVNAVHNADFIRIMLQPQYNVAAANFWHFSNGYWGMVKGYSHKKQALVKQANYYVFELYKRYLGEKLLSMQIDSPMFEFTGCCTVSPRLGRSAEGSMTMLPPSVLPESWSRSFFSEGSQSQDDGMLTVEFSEDKDLNYYHAMKKFEVEPNTLYKISVEVKTDDIKNGKVGIEVQDARGWKNTYSRAKNVSVNGTTDWAWITTEYRTLPDTKKIKVLARRYKGKGKISGRAHFRGMKVEKNTVNFGAVQSVVGTASQSSDGDIIYLVLINKNLDDKIDLSINIGNTYQVSSAESLTGPSAYATNLEKRQPDLVNLRPLELRNDSDGTFVLTLPALSVSGIAFKRVH